MKRIAPLVYGVVVGVLLTGSAVSLNSTPTSKSIIDQLVNSGCTPLSIRHNPEVKMIELICTYGD